MSFIDSFSVYWLFIFLSVVTLLHLLNAFAIFDFWNRSQGIWFAAMNLSVHSIMYFYYFMGAVGLRKVVRPFAPLITTIQILQMVGGIAVTVTAALHYDR